MLPLPLQVISEGTVVVLCVTVCTAFLFWLLLLSFHMLKRLQTFLALAKSCLLLNDVFFLFLKSSKSLWCSKKYISKLYAHIFKALGYLKASMVEWVKLLRNCIILFSFVSYGSVKMLTNHFSCGDPLQIRLAVSWNFFKMEISLHATNRA